MILLDKDINSARLIELYACEIWEYENLNVYRTYTLILSKKHSSSMVKWAVSLCISARMISYMF